ncbi:chloramphenicol-sensitive protein RarD [Agromyces flavus]|uniref:Chloramphenicol-sensitive protein RarD n=1 Tax=Agromyces flavus TaxID=589382 RepID=A0A1H1LS61_9MICO|nr:EamA family transporter RarD [Agromyces flavus]MCP2368618.1 chloramphenicol-sensitive protein RarD [Agromyces flavus]GGI48142.1 protein RarD [Agromyces flavus]SDR77464.1 chloramphenicol-sensitive protein RarD [Agromyces flavus]
MTSAPPTASRARTPRASLNRAGLAYAVSAYALWGFLPIYFIALAPTTPVEIVAWRILLSLVFCALLIALTRSWRTFAGLLRDRRVVLIMGAAGALIFVNWLTYVFAAVSGQVVEAALGYFINPIVTVFLGVLVLRERLNAVQWTAVGISIVAVVVLAVGYGQVPWIALVLAFSFGFYGLIKKHVGPRVDAVSGLTLETAWLAPLAAVLLVVEGLTTGLTMGTEGTWHTVLLLAAGAVTAIPLLLFAAASRRLPLIYMGFIQYFAPFIQFLVGVVILNEPMPLERWIGFGLVWIALVVLAFDLARGARAARRAALAAL